MVTAPAGATLTPGSSPVEENADSPRKNLLFPESLVLGGAEGVHPFPSGRAARESMDWRAMVKPIPSLNWAAQAETLASGSQLSSEMQSSRFLGSLHEMMMQPEV